MKTEDGGNEEREERSMIREDTGPSIKKRKYRTKNIHQGFQNLKLYNIDTCFDLKVTKM